MASRGLREYRFTLKPTPPFMFSAHLDRFTLDGQPSPGLWFRSTRTLQIAVMAGGRLAGVQARFMGEPWEPLVALIVFAEKDSIAEKAAEAFAKIIRSDLNYLDFMEKLKAVDSRLYDLATRYTGLRPGRCLSLYAALVDSIVKQRLPLRLSTRIYARLVQNYGSRLSAMGKTYYWHPNPEKLADIDVDTLRSLGLTRVKSRAIREVALAELEGRLPSVEEANNQPDMVIRELTKLYGVGLWTAQLAVAMVNESFPVGPISDLAVARGLAYLIGVEEKTADNIAGQILQRIPEYGGLILYLASYDYEERREKLISQRGRPVKRTKQYWH